MRKLLVAVAFAAIVVQVAAATSTPRNLTFSGTISALRSSAITVRDGRSVTCSVERVSPIALGYVIGSSARITCLRGILIKIVDPTTPLPMIKSGTGSPQTASAPRVAPTLVSSATATGTITAVTPTSITIGSTTCPFNTQLAQLGGIVVGETGSMSCATYSNGSTSVNFHFNNPSDSQSVTGGSTTLG